MNSEVAWVLVSSEIQVQPQLMLNPDYLPDYLSVSYDYVRKHERHPSILKIKNIFYSFITFHFPKPEVADIHVVLKQTDLKKATEPDAVPQQLVKKSGNVIDKHLCNIMNMDIDNYVSGNTNVETVRPLYKKIQK